MSLQCSSSVPEPVEGCRRVERPEAGAKWESGSPLGVRSDPSTFRSFDKLRTPQAQGTAGSGPGRGQEGRERHDTVKQIAGFPGHAAPCSTRRPCARSRPGCARRVRTGVVQAPQVAHQPNQEPELLQPEVGAGENIPAPLGVRSFDQPFQHVEGRGPHAVTSGCAENAQPPAPATSRSGSGHPAPARCCGHGPVGDVRRPADVLSEDKFPPPGPANIRGKSRTKGGTWNPRNVKK